MEIKKLNRTNLTAIWDVFEDAITDTCYAICPFEDFAAHYYPDWALQSSFGAFKDGTLVGAITGTVYDGALYITLLGVIHAERGQGIGSALLARCEAFFKEESISSMNYSYRSTINAAWYIKEGCQHNGMAGALVNSPLYLFFLHHGYRVKELSDTFIVDLTTFSLPSNPPAGYEIGFYDPVEADALASFCEAIASEVPFVRVIKKNLALETPYPFLVVRHEGRIVGWTGALWNEESGRGHFDGVCVAPEGRGKGLGRALFTRLMIESKANGARYMSFFTGLDNPARKIYLAIGGEICATCATLQKITA